MEKKKPIIILFILLLIALTVVLVEKKFAEPYSTIEKLINDAKENKNISTYLIEQDEEWIPLKEQSKYGLIRKELDWKHFKDAINFKENIKIVYKEKYSFLYKLRNFNRKDASPRIYLYDSEGNELINMGALMLKANNDWKVIGTAEDRDIEFADSSEVTLSDIEEYLKDGYQGNMELLYEKLDIHSNLFDAELNTIKIADRIETKLVSGEKIDTVVLILTQRECNYQFLVFNRENNGYNFVGRRDFGYRLGYEDEINPAFRIVKIDDDHKYIAIRTQALGTGINIVNEIWYKIYRNKISKVLEYPIDSVNAPPPSAGFPMKVDGKLIKSEVIDGKPTIDVDFTISYVYELYDRYNIENDEKVSINKTIRYIWEEDSFISKEYKTNNDDWISRKEINNEILEKNFDKLMKISKTGDALTMDYLLRFLEGCGDSSKKELLFEKVKNYPYIKPEDIVGSALTCKGISIGFYFNYRNLSEDIKRVSFWYEEFNKGILTSDKRVGIRGLTNRDDKLGFKIANVEDGKRKIIMSASGLSSTHIDEIDGERDFIAINTDKIRIKKDKEILLGFVVWDVKNNVKAPSSFDNIESIIDCALDKKIYVFKCSFIN